MTTTFDQEEMYVSSCPSIIGCFDPESQHPQLGGSAVIASYCPSSLSPQLPCPLLLQSQQDALSVAYLRTAAFLSGKWTGGTHSQALEQQEAVTPRAVSVCWKPLHLTSTGNSQACHLLSLLSWTISWCLLVFITASSAHSSSNGQSVLAGWSS